MPDPRERMIRSAAALLAERGYQGTSFRDVIAHSGAPRGSIYHYFPHGKDQLVAAALAIAGDRAIAALGDLRGRDAAGVIEGFVAMWRALLVRSDFGTGCAVLGVTVSSDSPELVAQAASVFRAWRARLTELLAEAGVERPESVATLAIAACEGAVALSRSERSADPLDVVGAQLRALVAN